MINQALMDLLGRVQLEFKGNHLTEPAFSIDTCKVKLQQLHRDRPGWTSASPDLAKSLHYTSNGNVSACWYLLILLCWLVLVEGGLCGGARRPERDSGPCGEGRGHGVRLQLWT